MYRMSASYRSMTRFNNATLLDRCRKEIAPLLGAIPPAGTLRGEEEAHTDDIGRRGRCAPMHGITGGDRTRKKAKVRVQKVFSYRDGVRLFLLLSLSFHHV